MAQLQLFISINENMKQECYTWNIPCFWFNIAMKGLINSGWVNILGLFFCCRIGLAGCHSFFVISCEPNFFLQDLLSDSGNF